MYNKWVSIMSKDNIEYLCKCSCGEEETHNKDDLIYDKTRMCKKCIKNDNVERQRKKFEGMEFGSWKVENFIGNRQYICLCKECNTRYKRIPNEFKRGQSSKCKKCSGNELKDLAGKTFGDYRVIEYIGNHYWKCECTSCNTIRNVTSQKLTIDNVTKCVNCSNKEKGQKVLEDTIALLMNKSFGNLKVIGYNYDTHKYKCECQCKDKNIIEVTRSNLKDGHIQSCGCISNELRRNTMLNRYGDIASKRVYNPRDYKDIEALEDKEKFIQRYEELVSKIGRIPKSIDIALEFDITTAIALKYAHDYGVEVDTDTGVASSYEEDICTILGENNIIRHNRSIIQPQELDIYIPDKRTAIEFNGSYWHSTEYLDKYYHQKKTLDCAKKGVRLIHIFEHEWKDNNTQIKIIQLLKHIVSKDYIQIRAHKLNIKSVDAYECKQFLDKYHIQNNAFSEVRIGLYDDNNALYSIMTFGKPRFTNAYEYELVRFCTKPGYKIYGAASKLFNHFIDKYRPKSIVTYCDITKFSGNTYSKIGFTCSINDITEPNYCWVNSNLEVLSRYQTQKHKLIKKGIGTKEQTENEIMSNLGYYKVYNSGNLKMSWYSK